MNPVVQFLESFVSKLPCRRCGGEGHECEEKFDPDTGKYELLDCWRCDGTGEVDADSVDEYGN